MTRLIMLYLAAQLLVVDVTNAQQLPGTKPLTLEGDIASHLVDGVDRFLLRQLGHDIGIVTAVPQRRTSSLWHPIVNDWRKSQVLWTNGSHSPTSILLLEQTAQ
jgi:hypothetical protein